MGIAEQYAARTMAAVNDELDFKKIQDFRRVCADLVLAASNAERASLLAVHEFIGNSNPAEAEKFYSAAKGFLVSAKEKLQELGAIRNGK